MIRSTTARWVAACSLTLAIGLAGCSSNTTSDPTTSSSPHITTTTVHYVPRFVRVAGREVLVPTEQGHEPINAETSFGQNVIITATGFQPFKLYAAASTPIVFTNLTDSTQVVEFYDFPSLKDSKPIPPGMAWSFEYSGAINIGYGNRAGSHLGRLYIGGCPPSCGS